MLTATGDEASMTKRNRRAQDNLDMRIRLIPRAYSFALICLFLSAAAVALWAFFGSIPTKAGGDGMIVGANQQVFPVESRSSGRIRKLAVTTGDNVDIQDVVAELDQSALDSQISSARAAVKDLQTRFTAFKERRAAEVTEHEKTNAELQILFSRSITQIDKGRDAIDKLLANVEKLESKGLATSPTVLRNRLSYQSNVVELAGLKIKQAEAKQDLVDFKNDVARRNDDFGETLSVKQRELEQLEALRASDDTIRAAVKGRVEEIRVARGQSVDAATVIMTLVHGGQGFEMLAFLNPYQARRVEIGMPAQVVPSSVNKAEYGSIRGTVTAVSSAPVSKDYANDLLRNPQLAERMTSGGEMFLARISLAENADSASGFEWWSGAGPKFRIDAGTLASVEIVLRERPPITLVVPALKELLGF